MAMMIAPLIIVIFSILIVHVTSVTLTLKGLFAEIAEFQSTFVFFRDRGHNDIGGVHCHSPAQKTDCDAAYVLQKDGPVTMMSNRIMTDTSVMDAKEGIYRLLGI